MTPHPIGDWLRLLALTLLWGSAFLLTKVAVSALDPDLVVAGRLLVACLLLVPLAMWRSTRQGAGTPWGPRLWVFLLLIAVFGNALPFSLIAWGQQRIDSALAGILMAIMPLATLGLSHYLVPGERLTPYRVAGFLLGFTGVVVLMGPDAQGGSDDGEGSLLPMLAVLGGALCYAISAILARLRPASDALPSAAATTLMASGLMLPLVLGPGDPDPLGQATVTSAAAVLALGERPEPNALYALILILGGILLTQLERRRAFRKRAR